MGSHLAFPHGSGCTGVRCGSFGCLWHGPSAHGSDPRFFFGSPRTSGVHGWHRCAFDHTSRPPPRIPLLFLSRVYPPFEPEPLRVRDPVPFPSNPDLFPSAGGRRRARDAVPIDPTFNGRIRETSEPLGRRSSEPSSRPRRHRSTGAWDTTCVLEAPRIADHVPRVPTVGNRRVFRGTGSVLPAACGPRA